jgi:SAM-dependent methyltransferase
MRSLARRLQKTLHRHGLLGAIRHAAAKAARMLRELSPGRLRARRLKRAADREFDEAHGTDTGGTIHLSRLHVAGGNWESGFSYEAVDPRKFTDTLEAAKLHHEDYVFIDFGSGKGRALLLASAYPFRQIIGVEFAEELHRVAEQNVARYRAARQLCTDIRPMCADAVTFPIPREPVALYFNNPFDATVMGKVLENIRRSHAECPRAMVVLYSTPVLDGLLAGAGFLERVEGRKDYFSIYRVRGERLASSEDA